MCGEFLEFVAKFAGAAGFDRVGGDEQFYCGGSEVWPVGRIATTATLTPEKPVPVKIVETKSSVPVIPEFKAPSEDASSTLKTLNNDKSTLTKENSMILEPPVSKP